MTDAFHQTRAAAAVFVLAALAAAPAFAAGDLARAEGACTAAAKARKLPVTGVDGVRTSGDGMIDVTLRLAVGAPTACRFDERTGGTSFPAATATPAAAPAGPVVSPTTRAADVCTATAKQQGIRLGKLESVLAVGSGAFDVRYARAFFGKPQLCRYDPARNLATFAGAGGMAALPQAPTVTDPKTAQDASQSCLGIVQARGQMEASVLSVKPLGGGFHEVEIRLGPAATDPVERCRYNAQTRTAAPI